MYPYEDEVPLDSLIEGAVEEYEQSREQHFLQGDEKSRNFLKLVDGLAGLIFSSTDALLRPSERVEDVFDWKAAVTAANIEGLAEFVDERLQILLARRFYRGTDHMAERARQVIDHVTGHEPNEQIVRFLRRLARCYVAGFLPECVILCRAVLETSLNDTFDRFGEKRPYNLKQKIETAGELGWISEETERKAHAVRERGNTAVHKDPEATTEVLETVDFTMWALEELLAADGRHGR
jgi:hypothetical protein